MTYLDNLIVELEKELTDRYGLMLPSRVLWKVLGYSSPDAWMRYKKFYGNDDFWNNSFDFNNIIFFKFESENQYVDFPLNHKNRLADFMHFQKFCIKVPFPKCFIIH